MKPVKLRPPICVFSTFPLLRRLSDLLKIVFKIDKFLHLPSFYIHRDQHIFYGILILVINQAEDLLTFLVIGKIVV